jgi:membrane associated rhomboid family serine protease
MGGVGAADGSRPDLPRFAETRRDAIPSGGWVAGRREPVRCLVLLKSMDPSATGTATQTCYRHPNRVTGVSCSNCGRPICPDCMTPTPVGMRCPECAKQRTKVHTARTMRSDPRVTVGIIIVCVVALLASGSIGLARTGSSRLFEDFALWGPGIADDGQYWRLVTGGFLHANLLHIFFNMYLLWILGQMLEPMLGSGRFTALYFTALLWGSFGALLLTPDAHTVGASGAVFGLMGAAAVELRSRGINPFQTDIGMLIIFNLGLSFVLSGISIGGHIGGLIGGALAGMALGYADRHRNRTLGYAACGVLMLVAVVGGIAAAGGSGLSG